MNGYNNNPDVVQFKSSLKRLLVKNSIRASQNGNCLALEESSTCSIFDLKSKKNSAPAVENPEDQDDDDDPGLVQLLQGISNSNLSEFQDAIVGYIAGNLGLIIIH